MDSKDCEIFIYFYFVRFFFRFRDIRFIIRIRIRNFGYPNFGYPKFRIRIRIVKSNIRIFGYPKFGYPVLNTPGCKPFGRLHRAQTIQLQPNGDMASS
ncbi:hypothetical protein Hanom_Chr09g00855851 [Helianthus anomalus]